MRPPRAIGFIAIVFSMLIPVRPANSAGGASCASCPVAGVKSHDSTALAPVQAKSMCSTGRGSNGYPIPDPLCTPGAFNSTVPPSAFGSNKFTTRCIRDCVTSGSVKKTTYKKYRITQNASCELDHLVPLEMGGGDSIENIWPQCGQSPDGQNYKDIKDQVESFLAVQVLLNKMDWTGARTGIASDWTQFISAAKAFCASNSCDIADYRK